MGLTADDDDGTVTIRTGDGTLARYRAATAASKPHFDVVAVPPSATDAAGRNLVLAAPHDHQWHLGLFFCQKLVDGINCWESELYEADGRPHGAAEHVDYGVTRDADAVTITQDVTWRKDTGERLLADARAITVHEPERGGYLLTWHQSLEAIDETRYLSSETLHGHYSGFSVRFARSMTNGRVRLPATESPETDETIGPRGTWCDYSGGIDGRVGTDGTEDPWTAGIALLNHPTNEPHPVRWFAAREPFGFLSANPTFETVATLPEGDTRSWRWGAWVHAGTPDRDAIESAYERFVDVA
ncbi:DUF6807 family protein [Halomontanus rarus]|uniref:DUF6807 family protein n=1 Tax=Halomontanus rarus TaxID=3034020 RepID=UPI0023E8FB49|nr:DUF6807 family protein [Halovivax sp. TS33]